MAKKPEQGLGVDLNGPICGPDGTPVLGAFKALKKLRKRFNGRVYIISRASEGERADRLKWLDDHAFFVATGIDRNHIIFCVNRADKSKIAKRLRLTHFVDDRLEVVGPMAALHRFLISPRPTEVQRFIRHLPGVQVLEEWPKLTLAIEQTF